MKLKDLDRRVITSTSGSDSDWRAAWKVYQEKNKDKENGNDIWKLVGWKKPEKIGGEDAPEYFVRACTEKAQVRVKDENDPLYKQVREFCTREATQSDFIKEGSERLENKVSNLFHNNRGTRRRIMSFDTRDKYWKERWSKYREDSSDPWGLLSLNTLDTPPMLFINRCLNIEAVTAREGLEDPLYKSWLEYCTREQTVKDLINENDPYIDLLTDYLLYDQPHWSENTKKYYEDNEHLSDGKDIWKLKDWKWASEFNHPYEGLRERCIEKYDLEIPNVTHPDYKNVLRYCARS